ncbi:MAG: hypothetical protein WCF65_09485 [Parachlamydiaceae bacterium]
MTSLTALVQTTTYDMTPPAARLSPVVWTAFSVLNKVHGVWRWFRRIELYRNPDNLGQLLAGHLVNFAIGDVTLLRIAAQCLLISTRVLECVQQQGVLCCSGRHLLATIKGHYPSPTEVHWDVQVGTGLQMTLMPVWSRIKRIACSTFDFLKQIFKLSMNMMDAIDTFCLSPYTRNEGIDEGFVNVMKWLDTLVENKEELLAGIVGNRMIFERILTKSPFTYNQLRDGVANALEKTELIAVKARKITAFGNGMLIDIGKKVTGGTMVMMGLADCRPAILAETPMQ